MHVAHQYFCKDCHLLHPVHCYLCMEKSHETSSSAAQPAIVSSLVGSSAEQPARVAAQPVKALRSITDVQRWLKNNEVVLSSSAEVMRIREVVDELMRRSWYVRKAAQHCILPTILELPEPAIRFFAILLDLFSCLYKLYYLFLEAVASNHRHASVVLVLFVNRFKRPAYR